MSIAFLGHVVSHPCPIIAPRFFPCVSWDKIRSRNEPQGGKARMKSQSKDYSYSHQLTLGHINHTHNTPTMAGWSIIFGSRLHENLAFRRDPDDDRLSSASLQPLAHQSHVQYSAYRKNTRQGGVSYLDMNILHSELKKGELKCQDQASGHDHLSGSCDHLSWEVD
jgi:hypothetical protein